MLFNVFTIHSIFFLLFFTIIFLLIKMEMRSKIKLKLFDKIEQENLKFNAEKKLTHLKL